MLRINPSACMANRNAATAATSPMHAHVPNTKRPLLQVNLSGADLSAANLSRTTLVETDLEQANLTCCSVYGISAWNVSLKGASQSNLLITSRQESKIEVDNLESPNS